jgi:manganese-dependent inorganic pyrophosphatase
MEENNITGVPIIDKKNKFKDIITAKMILKASFDTDNYLYSSYDNILKTLNAEEVLRFNDEIKGHVNAITYKSTTFIENFNFTDEDILIVGDRHSIIEAAVKNKVELIILTEDSDIKEEHIKIAKENHVNIIKTKYNSFKTIKKIMFSNYIKNIFTGDRPFTLQETDYYDDFVEESKKLGYNNYPIVDKDGICKGLLRLTDVRNKKKKKVILVDHNEIRQSVEGLDEAEILEVIDHHKIGDISTNNPINFRNMTVGSTNTIVYTLFQEARVEIPKDIASIMLGGIISDTLALTSPTTTSTDIEVVKKLEKISGLNYKEYAQDIFNAGSNIENKPEIELIKTDIKQFNNGNKTFRVSQIIIIDASKVLERKDKFIEALNKIKEEKNDEFVLLMVTDILKNGSHLLYSDDQVTRNVISRTFDITASEGMFLEGMVSRKKQIIPLIMEND